MRLTMIMAAALCAAPLAAHAAEANMATFSVGGVVMEVPIPKGYCKPRGAGLTAADFTASVDKENVTHLTLQPCGDDGSSADYYIFKTPINVINTPFARASLLAELTPQFDKPEFREMIRASATDKAGQSFSEATGIDTAVTGTVTPLGIDDTCAYMGGVMSFKNEVTDYARAASLCMTVIGTRFLGIYRYSPGEQVNVFKHMPTIKAMANAIRVVADK